MAQSILILNPEAAGGRHREAVVEWARGQTDLDLLVTQAADDVKALAAEACDSAPKCLIVAGGDGTIHQAIHGMMAAQRRPILAVLPIGTANDYARSLGIIDLPTAMAAIDQRVTVRADVARFGGQPDGILANAATAGLSVAISDEMDDATKSFWGRYAYATTAAKLLAAAPNHEVEVTTDEGNWSGRVSAVMVGNGGCAGGVCLIPSASVSDGLLDAVVVEATEAMDLLRVLALFALGRQLDDERVHHFHTRRVQIESDPPLSFSVDGEPIAETPLDLEVIAGELEVVVHRAANE